ncbi:hypothetical protein KBI23_13935 [bacterium]|nr:hypothetical protein [bacterium]
MCTAKTDYWKDLTQWFSFALHQLAYIPACCIHAIEQELRAKHGAPHILHRPPDHSQIQIVNHFETATKLRDHVEKAAIEVQPHICRGCGDDIISRVHSSHAHQLSKVDNDTFHDWLANDQPHLDLYEQLPHVNAFEENLEGFNEEHLQRIEKYWAEHQLSSPKCAIKAVKLATAADWERTKQLAIENSERP